jgi:hypothetical protein
MKPSKNLFAAHERIATLNACALENYGFVMLDDVIVSKTNRGYLETKQLGARKYEHALVGYDDVPVRLIIGASL